MIHAKQLQVHVAAVVILVATIMSRAPGEPAPATRPAPAPPVHVELPSGWEAKSPEATRVLQFASYPDLNAYFELLVQPKSDFAKRVDLPAWAKLARGNTAKKSKLANREETQLKEGKIGDRPTVEYEVTGEENGLKLHFRFIMVEVGGYYCNLACWTTPSHWEAAQPKFEELVGQLKS